MNVLKEPLLFLAHRIPYPPNKGDKIRSWHLLKFLAERYRIYLASFIDDPYDWQYTDVVRDICEDCCFIALNSKKAKMKSLRAFVQGRALSEPYFYNAKIQRWVDAAVAEQGIKKAVVYSSPMAQYVLDQDRLSSRVVDFVDVDSDKWRQYAWQKSWPLSWVYRREAKKLFQFEHKVANAFDASLFVSAAEADLFRQMAPDTATKVGHYNNGVDFDYFDPQQTLPNPYKTDDFVLVFTGAMDYWPNIDAVCWFASEIWPGISARYPHARFYVVGSNPSREVKALSAIERVQVTGRVEDIRPYIAHASAAVAPLRVARGIQNKVLEAMAMAVPVIVSPQGLEGIAAKSGEEVLLANTPVDYVDAVDRLMKGECSDLGRSAQNFVQAQFSWQQNLPVVVEKLNVGGESDE